MLLLWNALLTLFWPLLYLYRPFRGTIAQRLGRGLPDWSGTQEQVFLINAVSAGEVVAITPFIQELRRRRPDCRIALLTTTGSGQEMARSKLDGLLDLLGYFPLVDLPFAVRRYLDRLHPALYITTESELWPNIQGQCQARQIPVVSLNARVYLHNKQGWRGELSRKLYSLCDLIVCQSELHYRNFVLLGVPERKLVVSGNTKFDFALPDWKPARLADWRGQWGIPPAAPCIVAGSTHPGEEELLLAVLRFLPEHGAGLAEDGEAAQRLSATRLVLAPRHVERASEVAELARSRGHSAMTMHERESAATSEPAPQVLVVDRYGVLVDFYRLADVVVMGGTFNPKVGGHNLLEATALGKPVVIGPSTFGIAAQVELLDSENAVIHGLGAEGELVSAIRQLMLDRQRAEETGSRAQRITLASRGASVRAVEAVLALLA